MTTESYFNEAHRTVLKDVFTRLADFIHEHGLQQVVSIGPSAAPYTKHIAAAYERRYGRRVRVFNLGVLGEKLGDSSLDSAERSLARLRRAKPEFDIGRNTLLFDEVSASNVGIQNASRKFRQMGILHKTAVLGRHWFSRDESAPDFTGFQDRRGDRNSLVVRLSLGVSNELVERRIKKLPLFNFKKVHNELREIADSVPIKEEAKRRIEK